VSQAATLLGSFSPSTASGGAAAARGKRLALIQTVEMAALPPLAMDP